MFGMENTFPPALVEKINSMQVEGVTAEFAKIGGIRMDEPKKYDVIIDRISQDIQFYRAYLKNAALQGTIVVNNPFWWTADDKFFNYALAHQLGVAIPPTVILPHNKHPEGTTDKSMRNLMYPLNWQELFDYVGFPAFLKPYSGGGWKHVYKVENKQELLEAYDRTSPYCMTLQQFIDFDLYVRCFTFGKTDITPVAYDPKQRRYLVEHEYLSADVGARVVRDAQLINLALGYEMNTIEFAIAGGVPYAIDYLNPAPDFERDRITPFYFSHVVEKMAHLVVDRALNGHPALCWPRWEEMLGIGPASGFTGAPGLP